MKTIDWDSLTFVNNYVFQEVLKNKKLCKYLIERILHIQIKDIRYLIAERHINSARISSKSIRLDVYVENQEGRQYFGDGGLDREYLPERQGSG